MVVVEDDGGTSGSPSVCPPMLLLIFTRRAAPRGVTRPDDGEADALADALEIGARARLSRIPVGETRLQITVLVPAPKLCTALGVRLIKHSRS